jgi:hypothetical protein
MLFNFLKNKESIKDKNNSSSYTDILNIDIKYDHHDHMIINASYNDKAETHLVATAIFMLNKGQFMPAILESLAKNSESHVQQIILSQILNICNELMSNNDKDPIIRPSDVFIKKYDK